MAEIEQRTGEWRQQRAGKITASRFADAIAMKEVTVQRATKSQFKRVEFVPTEARNRYHRELVAEILSGNPKHEVKSKSLSWGRDVEPYAREAYELETGHVVAESGFLLHPEYDFIGASPDGLIGSDGGLEMKCPIDEQVHIETLLQGMPSEHTAQVQGCMFVTGRNWWDFVSYQPAQAEDFRLYVERIPRDGRYIAKLQAGLLQFWGDVQKTVEYLRNKAA